VVLVAAEFTVDGQTIHVETNGEAPNSRDAVKRFVDARISITPDDVNEVGDPHTFASPSRPTTRGRSRAALSVTIPAHG
jgi:hypothetical protein